MCEIADKMSNNVQNQEKNYVGNKWYAEFKKGRKLTRKQAMDAHCAECMGFYQDGRQDCCGYSCPLYDWRPKASRASKMQKEKANV